MHMYVLKHKNTKMVVCVSKSRKRLRDILRKKEKKYLI